MDPDKTRPDPDPHDGQKCHMLVFLIRAALTPPTWAPGVEKQHQGSQSAGHAIGPSKHGVPPHRSVSRRGHRQGHGAPLQVGAPVNVILPDSLDITGVHGGGVTKFRAGPALFWRGRTWWGRRTRSPKKITLDLMFFDRWVYNKFGKFCVCNSFVQRITAELKFQCFNLEITSSDPNFWPNSFPIFVLSTILSKCKTHWKTKVTGLHDEDQWVTGRERFHHMQSQQKGLAPPHDQLIHRNVNGAMADVVGPAVEICFHDHCDRKIQNYYEWNGFFFFCLLSSVYLSIEY